MADGTATRAYQERRAQLQRQLARLAVLLDEHSGNQGRQPENWGYVGDLGRVGECLAEALAALGYKEQG